MPPPPSGKHAVLESALRELPLFPLPQAVLFPGAVMPLHIFEPRYRQMTRDALDTHRILVVTQILPGPESPPGHPAIARVAGAGSIVEAQELPDGRYNIILEGRARVHLTELPFVPPYRRARGELLDDRHVDVPEIELHSLVAVANAFAVFVQARDPSFSFSLPPSLPPGRLADLCAHHLILDAKDRQRMLECLDPAARVRMVSESLALQLATMKGEKRGTLN
ncbi:MAG: LON peptidase substrate-binding domain-containing protein [Deltaproteobacteria bacterium]|nr:LON peptidase substrate-binding domain-containing protein [Deltaproteobacteria bacterium]